MVFRSEFFPTYITDGRLFVVFDIFGKHLDRFLKFKSVVDIMGFLFQHIHKLFDNVFSLMLLGIVYQLGFVDGIVETLDVVTKSAGAVLLVLSGT
jgi:hypothetical protein